MSKKIICAGRTRLRASAVVLAMAFLPGLALAQQPTEAQTSAIRSSCQTDYRAHCASVPPGGSAALACLQKNAASLSSACRTAVTAVGGGSAPAATTAAAPPASPAAAPPAAAAIPTAPPPAGAAKPAATTAKATAQPDAFPPLSPREELMALRLACGADYRALCAGVRPGQGRAIGCLRANGPSLSDGCKSALLRRASR